MLHSLMKKWAENTYNHALSDSERQVWNQALDELHDVVQSGSIDRDIKEFDKVVDAIAAVVPDGVHDDVSKRWNNVRKHLSN